ncbi:MULTISPECIES: hypothetical protein [Desulfosporosinus]|uniref:Uncharacterized protein n=1 Tax=Desulfosporosinus acididurans TaxID=476652 RepID=A0A0J1FL76_9FIRM|nr:MULTISPECIES: hypothetical protein [Desulfosporosinus]KLU64235.1 hypothetical protein DEAC_c38680 [Desulfosporosinus acididurans]
MNNRSTNVTKYNGSNHLNLIRNYNVPSVGYKLFRVTSKNTDTIH